MEEMKIIENEFDQMYGQEYRKGQGHCGPTNPNHQFDGDVSVVKSVQTTTTAATAASELAQLVMPKAGVEVFSHPVVDYINTLLPNGAPEGSRHKWLLKLAGDLLILCDNAS